MCATCGCGQTDPHPSLRQGIHAHSHAEGHGHDHSHEPGPDHEHHHERAASVTRVIEVGQAVLAENDRFAAQNRVFFDRHRTRCLNLISSPGSGKTTLLEQTLLALRDHKVPCAVIEGDQTTDLDARRIARTGVSVFQIQTGRSCHLDARQIQHAVQHVQTPDQGLLFIENVGNLICPTEFALGEHERVTILSVTEGHDKPAKYPLAFSSPTAVVISKIDLLPHVDFDLGEARRVIAGLNPRAPVFEVSAFSGAGMQAWLSWLTGAPLTGA